jgi:hypothetical protein
MHDMSAPEPEVDDDDDNAKGLLAPVVYRFILEASLSYQTPRPSSICLPIDKEMRW